MRRSLLKKLSLIIGAIGSLGVLSSLSGCYDLGVLSTNDIYISSFGDIKGIYDGGSVSYELKDLIFTNSSDEDFSWEAAEDLTAFNKYVYVAIPVKADLNIEEFAMWVRGTETISMEVSFFYFESEADAPSKIKYLSSPDTEMVAKKDADGNIEKDADGNIVYEEKEIEYDDPLKETRVASYDVSLKDSWGAFLVEGFNQTGYDDELLHTKNGGYIYIRFENNSGLNKETLTSTSFQFTCVLIRAI